jgi:predicted RNA polymerase sigma factor
MTSTSAPSSTSAEPALPRIYRAEWGRLLSLLVSRTRRLDLVEDALSEAFARAAQRWPREGTPVNPAGWLYTTAHRQVVGRLRAEAVAGRKAPLLAVRPGWVSSSDPDEPLADDRLHLILLCCHPAISHESRSALALRLVIGTPTEQIARLFLVSPTTMAARLTRAKKKVVQAGIPLGSPIEDELRSRLDEVCRTIYLAFTAGYAPGVGPDLLRADLSGEAVRLAEVLNGLVPNAAQGRALRALLLLQHSRRGARVHNGQLVTLADQDRSTWRHDETSTITASPPSAATSHIAPATLTSPLRRTANRSTSAPTKLNAPTSAGVSWKFNPSTENDAHGTYVLISTSSLFVDTCACSDTFDDSAIVC